MAQSEIARLDPKTVLLLPGWNGSAEQHWQSIWERKFGFRRIEQVNWSIPCRTSWLAAIAEETESIADPIRVVAHSLGCLALAHLAVANPRVAQRIAMALMVAPPDLDDPVSDPIRAFGAPPLARLPFRTTLVGSQNDPYMRETKAKQLASAWGAEFVSAGPVGHINCASGFGPWRLGERLLERACFPGEQRLHSATNGGTQP